MTSPLRALAAALCLLLPAAALAKGKAAAPAGPSPALLDPQKAALTAPKVFKAKLVTTKGEVVVEVHRDWAPKGADRFYTLVKHGWFTDVAFFRAIEGFMVQFGISGQPELNLKWREARIGDDPPAGQTNARGMISFAMAGPNTRTTQMFVNYKDNGRLDGMGFTPFGKVVKGMEVLDALHKGYGEGAPRGAGPDQGRVQEEGNAYLKKEFPLLDYVKSASIEK